MWVEVGKHMHIVVSGQVLGYPALRPEFPLSGVLMGSVVDDPVRVCLVVFAGKSCVGPGWPEATLSG